MEAKENMGVTVIGAEAPSNYHVAPRTDGPPHTTLSPPVNVTPTSTAMVCVVEKKKRGRPRKYGPDGNPRPLSPMPISASAPPSTTGFSSGSGKRGRGRGHVASNTHQQHKVESAAVGHARSQTDGANFTPHVITVNIGEDVTAKIISFCQQGPRAVCILSANGMISNATLRQSDSSGGTLTYEGRFEIVNLCGSYTPTERDGNRYRAGGISVSLSSPNGQVVGGCVAGLLVAATPVQIIVGSFLPSSQPEYKPKKQKLQPVQPFTITAVPASTANKEDGCSNGQGNNHHDSSSGHHMPNLATASSYHRDGWPGTQSMQDSRKSTDGWSGSQSTQDIRKSTDINISLPGGMQ